MPNGAPLQGGPAPRKFNVVRRGQGETHNYRRSSCRRHQSPLATHSTTSDHRDLDLAGRCSPHPEDIRVHAAAGHDRRPLQAHLLWPAGCRARSWRRQPTARPVGSGLSRRCLVGPSLRLSRADTVLLHVRHLDLADAVLRSPQSHGGGSGEFASGRPHQPRPMAGIALLGIAELDLVDLARGSIRSAAEFLRLPGLFPAQALSRRGVRGVGFRHPGEVDRCAPASTGGLARLDVAGPRRVAVGGGLRRGFRADGRRDAVLSGDRPVATQRAAELQSVFLERVFQRHVHVDAAVDDLGQRACIVRHAGAAALRTL